MTAPPAGTGTGEPLEAQIAEAIDEALYGPWWPAPTLTEQAAAAVMAVVQPALDAKDAEEVLVEGLFFPRSDLPRILGKFMRSSAETHRETKDALIRLDAANRALEREAATAREAVAALAAVRELHRPWYEINGKRHDHVAIVGDSDIPADHVCRKGGADPCDSYDESHSVLACVECRQTADGDPGYLFWPCPTMAALEPKP